MAFEDGKGGSDASKAKPVMKLVVPVEFAAAVRALEDGPRSDESHGKPTVFQTANGRRFLLK